MTVEIESGIEFDFRSALALHLHDKPIGLGGEGNDIWKGVDFRVKDADGWIWVEVKSWDPRRLSPRKRGGNQRSFVKKMKSASLGLELRAKFFGTTAFLAWTGGFLADDLTYVVVIQPPRPLDKALLGTFSTRVKSVFPSRNNWTHVLSVAVVDVADWNAIYTGFPARII